MDNEENSGKRRSSDTAFLLLEKNNYKTAKTSFLAMRGNVCWIILFLISDYKDFLFYTAILLYLYLKLNNRLPQNKLAVSISFFFIL